MIVHHQVVYKIPYRRARAWPSASREQRYLAYKPSGRNLIAPNFIKIIKLMYSRKNLMIVHHQVEM